MGLVSMSALFKGLVVALQLLVVVVVSVNGLTFDQSLLLGKVVAPVVAPVAAPVAAPSPVYLPIRKLVAVQGVVYNKSCKYLSSDTLTGASPLVGAVVNLKCSNGKTPIVVQGKTDKNGYFFIQPPKKVSTFGVHKCKVYLVSSPFDPFKNATNLGGGLSGAYLRYEKLTKPVPFALYTVGPFAFAPTKCPK